MTRMYPTLLCALVFAVCVNEAAHGALIALYRFEDASGTVSSTIADSSSNGHDGTVNGANIAFASSVSGFGNAGDFRSTTGWVKAALTGVGATVGDFTFAAWIKPEDLDGTDEYIVARNANTFNQLSMIWEFDTDAVELFKTPSGAPDTRPGSDIILSNTDWHHIVYTRSGTDYDFYLDGAKTDIGTLSGNLTNIAETLTIDAGREGLNPFGGLLDDVAYFDQGLTAAQVAAIMAGDFSEFGVANAIPTPAAGVSGLALIGLLASRRWRG